MGKPITQDRKEKEDKNENEGLKKDMRKQKGQTIANKNTMRNGKRTENKGTTKMKNRLAHILVLNTSIIEFLYLLVYIEYYQRYIKIWLVLLVVYMCRSP